MNSIVKSIFGALLIGFVLIPNYSKGQQAYQQFQSNESPGPAFNSKRSGLSDNFNKKLPVSIKFTVADTFHVDVAKSWRIAFGNTTLDKSLASFYDISDDVTIGGEWIESHDHFAVWDSRKVNPYDFDPVKFEDSVSITLMEGDAHWIMPLNDSIAVNSKFGMRRYRWHYGVDLDLERGDSVMTVADGIVRVSQYDRYGYGHYVVVRHKNGLETLYGHFSKTLVRVGQEVRQGDLLGLGGSTGRSTGNHLHFEVRYKGAAVNPEELYSFTDHQIMNDKYLVSPESFAYIKELRKKRYHRIRSGDTLSRISRRYHTSINAICRLNGISRNKVLKIGRTLRVK